MGKILDARGDEAYDVMDALIEAIEPILADKEIADMFRGPDAKKTTKLQAIRKIISLHRDEVTRIIAIDDGITPDEEKNILNALTIPAKFIRLFNNPVVHELFFGSAATNGPADGSSAASERGNG